MEIGWQRLENTHLKLWKTTGLYQANDFWWSPGRTCFIVFGTRYAQVMNLCATNIALFSCALLSASAPDNTSMSALPVHKNTEKLCSPQFPTSRPLKEHTHGFWWLLCYSLRFEILKWQLYWILGWDDSTLHCFKTPLQSQKSSNWQPDPYSFLGTMWAATKTSKMLLKVSCWKILCIGTSCNVT